MNGGLLRVDTPSHGKRARILTHQKLQHHLAMHAHYSFYEVDLYVVNPNAPSSAPESPIVLSDDGEE